MFQIERLLAAILFLRVTDISLVLLISPGEYRACGRRIRERRPPIFANFFPSTTIIIVFLVLPLRDFWRVTVYSCILYSFTHSFTHSRVHAAPDVNSIPLFSIDSTIIDAYNYVLGHTMLRDKRRNRSRPNRGSRGEDALTKLHDIRQWGCSLFKGALSAGARHDISQSSVTIDI